MKISAVLIVLGILIILGACSKTPLKQFKAIDLLNGVLPSSGYALQKDIVYGADARQKIDIYRSRQNQETEKPLIVFIYGGAWRSGDKAEYKFVAHALVSAGYDVVIPDYRLFPEVAYPAFIEDAADAIVFVEKNAIALLGKQPKSLVLMGHSAGAHTAALLATNQAYFNERSMQMPLTGLIALAGPHDLPLDDPEVTPVFQNFNHEDEVKPVRLAHKNLPKVLLLHGLKDKRVLPFHTVNFAHALQQAGTAHEVKLYEKVGHVGILASLAAPLRFLNDSYRDVLSFLEGL